MKNFYLQLTEYNNRKYTETLFTTKYMPEYFEIALAFYKFKIIHNDRLTAA